MGSVPASLGTGASPVPSVRSFPVYPRAGPVIFTLTETFCLMKEQGKSAHGGQGGREKQRGSPSVGCTQGGSLCLSAKLQLSSLNPRLGQVLSVGARFDPSTTTANLKLAELGWLGV